MFTVFLVVLIWWLMGVVGMILVAWADWDDSSDDITIGILFNACGYSIAGPIIWVIVAMYLWNKINFEPLEKKWAELLDIKITGRPKKVKVEEPIPSEEIKFTNHKPTYDRMQEIIKRKAQPSEEATLKTNLLED